ncbi:MAG: DUF2000 domain-containing protein [Firmicutes bacterium HGW-Firmicutes-9]|jgi:hypothetical protein|nr:MAG: DUF2000 domain-containing protein [Firmicutes bacterium HGW-Firmicutes-9]
MNGSEQKCVVVIDNSLPLGLIANTAAILGTTLGARLPQMVGRDVCDATGNTHCGINTVPTTVLQAGEELLKTIRTRLFEPEFSDVLAVDFSDVAQRIHIYEDYLKEAEETHTDAFQYFGIALYGDKKKVNRLTGMLPLLRA